MCGRFSRFTGQDAIIANYGVDQNRAGPLQSYNIAPSQVVSVVRRENPIVLEDMMWGFIPFFAKDLSTVRRPINARDDSLSKNMYKFSIENKRCLIPADGFFEWKKYGPIKQPFFIRKYNLDLMSFGGIYSKWHNPQTQVDEFSFAIITTPPNDLMAEIHNRMPLILEKNQINQWLDLDLGYNDIGSIIKPYDGKLDVYPVSMYVNNPKNNAKKCIQPISKDEIGRDLGQKMLDDYF